MNCIGHLTPSMVFIFLGQTILFIYFFQICLTSYVQMKEKERFKTNTLKENEKKLWKYHINMNSKIFTVHYPLCQCIEYSKYTRKTATNSNTNEACHTNTDHNKDHIKGKECNTKPAKQTHLISMSKENKYVQFFF